jgi:hypothetical protein
MVNGRFGLLLIIVALPFMNLERLLVSNLGPGDLFIMLLIVTTWLVLWRQRTPVNFPLMFGFWLIMIGSDIATMSGLGIPAASKAIAEDLYLFVLFLTLANAITDRRSLQTLLKAWAIVAAVEAVLIIGNLAHINLPIIGGLGAKSAALGATTTNSTDRAVGTFLNANAAGGYMLLSLAAVASISFPRNRLLRLGLWGLYLAAIVATGSIGAMLGTGVAAVVAIVYWLYRRGRSLVFWLGLGFMGIFFGTLLAPVGYTLITSVSSKSGHGGGGLLYELTRINNKLDKRFALWSRVAPLMENAWLGIGPNVTAQLVTIGAHSDYIAYFSERGEIGVIGLFVLLGEVIFWIVLAARAGPGLDGGLATGALLGGLFGQMLMATVHETMHGRPVWLLYAVIFLHYKFSRAEARSGQAIETNRAAPLISGSAQSLA